MPVVKEREYRSLNLRAATETNKRFNSDFYVEGYATTFDDPYLLYEIEGEKYFEVIERDALKDADMSDVIFQYNHEGRVLARRSNGTLDIIEDEHGLLTFADLSKTQAARDMYEDISNQLVTKMSWAFTIEQEAYERSTHTRIIQKIKKVYDVSAVSIPANDGTEIAARSFVLGRIEQEKREALLIARKKAAIARINIILGGH